MLVPSQLGLHHIDGQDPGDTVLQDISSHPQKRLLPLENLIVISLHAPNGPGLIRCLRLVRRRLKNYDPNSMH